MEIKNILKVCQRCCWTTDWEPLVCSKVKNGGRKGVAGGIVQTFFYLFKYFNIIGTRPLSETERRQEVLEVWRESIKQSLRGQDHLSMEVEKMQGTILGLIWNMVKVQVMEVGMGLCFSLPPSTRATKEHWGFMWGNCYWQWYWAEWASEMRVQMKWKHSQCKILEWEV